MFDQQKYINSFIKDNYRTIKLRIRNDDKLLINKINNVGNINKYILNLIKKDIIENRVYNYINNEIEIDFELSITMEDLINKAEEADILDDYGLYMNLADAIDSQGKKEASQHIITETEWRILTRRYCL
ncbi:MAG: hypothetical protein HFG91_05720 [Acholeplasmatales bacterium]|jgi:hypothetical protein|nr:hypothetical protein [Acholeplasmatales bacterium]MCI9653822.1 hypothetical protein [Acholeplasmatales bacterium]